MPNKTTNTFHEIAPTIPLIQLHIAKLHYSFFKSIKYTLLILRKC